MIEAVIDDLQTRVMRLPCDCGRIDDIALLEETVDLIEFGLVALAAMIDPPNSALKNHAYGGEGYRKDQPHDPAAFDEVLEYDVVSHREENLSYEFISLLSR